MTSELVEPAMPVDGGVGADAEGFGTRPRTDRPHSMNLFGGGRRSTRGNGDRAFGLLVGIGIGAAAMYYLDADGGPRRRAVLRGRIMSVFGLAGGLLVPALQDPGVKRE